MQDNLFKLNHYDLCKITAERFLKDSDIVLYEYNCQITTEMPDVLRFYRGYTELYEIKVNISDFKMDKNKPCRQKYKIKYRPAWKIENGKHKPCWTKYPVKRKNYEEPHLGSRRFYVCPSGMIHPKDIDDRWGLYWVKNGRFYLKKDSEIFNRNVFLEIKLLTHAMRKYASLDDTNILINKYNDWGK